MSLYNPLPYQGTGDPPMAVTTTLSIDGYRITRYLTAVIVEPIA